jgi:hypothetical protein
LLHGVLERGKQEIQNLLPVRVDRMTFASEVYLDARLPRAALAGFSVGQHIVNPFQEILLVIGLRQIVVRSRMQPPNDIFRIREGAEQDDGNVLQRLVTLDLMTQFVAIQLGHFNVADHQRRFALADQRQPFGTISGNGHRKTVLHERPPEQGRLYRTIFHNQDVNTGAGRCFLRCHNFTSAGVSAIESRWGLSGAQGEHTALPPGQ